MQILSIKESIQALNENVRWDDPKFQQAMMAQCARMAYLMGKEAKPLFKELGFSKHKYIEHDDAECHIVENKDYVVFAFRGTQPTEFNDIAADLKAWKHKSKTKGMVHDGFYDELNKLWKDVENYPTKGKHVFITGHSLGGAMATLCASRMCSVSQPMLITFGSPRVGNSNWIRANNGVGHWRFVNNNDVVPKVPPALLGFRHHGKLCYINYYGNIRELTWWQKVKDQWRARKRAWSKGQPFSGFTDHSMERYAQKLLDLYLKG
jgi:triacylglycerol lipase